MSIKTVYDKCPECTEEYNIDVLIAFGGLCQECWLTLTDDCKCEPGDECECLDS